MRKVVMFDEEEWGRLPDHLGVLLAGLLKDLRVSLATAAGMHVEHPAMLEAFFVEAVRELLPAAADGCQVAPMLSPQMGEAVRKLAGLGISVG